MIARLRKTWIPWTLGAIVVLLALRLTTFIAHDPLLAYANNFDMLRLQSCHQLWPTDREFPAGKQSPSRPLEYYTKTADNKYNKCFPSSERLFTSLLDAQLHEGQQFSIRHLAAVKAGVAVVLLGVLLSLLWRASSTLALLFGVLVLTLLPDPFNALYLSTFYMEWSATLGFYLTLGALLLAVTRPGVAVASWCLFGALVFWGLAKAQHLYVPALALSCLLPAAHQMGWRRMQRPLLAASAAAVLVLVVQHHWVTHERNAAVRKANAINTFFYTVLGSSDQPHKLAQRLGLPAGCGDFARLSWYSPQLDRRNLPCPEVFQASRFRLLLLPFLDTRAFTVMLADADQHLRPVFPANLGQVAGFDYGRVLNHRVSLFAWLDLLSARALAGLLVVSTLLAAGCALRRLLRTPPLAPARATTTAVSSLILFLSLYPASAFTVALLGDGHADLAKHSHLAFNGLLALLLVLAAALIAWLLPARPDTGSVVSSRGN